MQVGRVIKCVEPACPLEGGSIEDENTGGFALDRRVYVAPYDNNLAVP